MICNPTLLLHDIFQFRTLNFGKTMPNLSKYCIIFLVILTTSHAYTGMKLQKIADLPKSLYETSGLLLYKDKYLLTHNDSGNDNTLYVLNLKGEIIEKIEVDEATNRDWEDIAQDDEGNLYIADIGNNENRRKNCQIYILTKDLQKDKNERINADRIQFTYEDQEDYPPEKENMNYDAEALIWMNDHLYIFTKCRAKPFTGISNIYMLPDKPGKHTAIKIGSFNFCSLGWQFCSVTAADYYPETGQLAVLTYGRLYLISDFTTDRFWEGKIEDYNLFGLKQREGITYAGKNKWYMTDEFKRGLGGGNLYELTLNE